MRCLLGAIALLVLVSPASCGGGGDNVGGAASVGGDGPTSSSSSGDSASSSSSGTGGAGGATLCEPGASVACYDGPPATQDIGACKSGTKTCDADGTAFGPCVGEVLPALEDCATTADESCDGTACGDTLWAIEAGDGGYQAAHDVAVDSQGNSIVVGEFRKTLDLGNGVSDDAGSSLYTQFIAKLAPDGTAKWLKKIPGDNNLYAQFISHVAVDASDAIVLSGYYKDHFTIDDLTVTTLGNGLDLFVAKLDSSGKVRWLRNGADSVLANVDSMTILPVSGDVVVGGYFCDTLAFGAATAPLFHGCGGAPKSTDGFVARFDATTGDAKFALDLGTSVRPFALAADALDEIIVGGVAEANSALPTIVVPPLSAARNATGATAFLARLLGDGTGKWIKTMGKEGAQSNVWHVAVDSKGDLAVVAEFDGSIDFGGPALTATKGAFWGVAKLHADGSGVWAKSLTVSTTTNFGYAQYPSLALDKADNIVMAGPFDGTVVFGSGQPLSSVGGYDIFVGKLAPDGQHVWSRSFGTTETDFVVAVDAAPNNAVVIAGSAWKPIDLGTGPLTYAGSSDIIVAEMAP